MDSPTFSSAKRSGAARDDLGQPANDLLVVDERRQRWRYVLGVPNLSELTRGDRLLALRANREGKAHRQGGAEREAAERPQVRALESDMGDIIAAAAGTRLSGSAAAAPTGACRS